MGFGNKEFLGHDEANAPNDGGESQKGVDKRFFHDEGCVIRVLEGKCVYALLRLPVVEGESAQMGAARQLEGVVVDGRLGCRGGSVGGVVDIGIVHLGSDDNLEGFGVDGGGGDDGFERPFATVVAVICKADFVVFDFLLEKGPILAVGLSPETLS